MEYSISSLNFPKQSLFSLCVSGVLDTICKEKMVIYSQLLIIVTKLTLPSFNQYNFVTVNAYPNRKDMLLPVYTDNNNINWLIPT